VTAKIQISLGELQGLALWHAQRTPSVSTDDKSVYRALVNCWENSSGPELGDPLDIELGMIIEHVMKRLDYHEIKRLAYEIDGAFEAYDEEDEDDRDLTAIVYQNLYHAVQDTSEVEYSERNG